MEYFYHKRITALIEKMAHLDRIHGRLPPTAPRRAVHRELPVDPEAVERVGGEVRRCAGRTRGEFDRLTEPDELKRLRGRHVAPNPLRLILPLRRLGGRRRRGEDQQCHAQANQRRARPPAEEATSLRSLVANHLHVLRFGHLRVLYG